jgi:tetratricopeptide (TPR) repeat protein
MARKKEPADPLNELLAAAKPETLTDLVVHLADFRPDMRRECFDYLKKHVSLTAEQKILSEGEIAMALWWELYPDLEDLDTYGGGDDETVDHVAGLLYEIQQKLAGKNINEEIRRQLLDEVVPFIKRGNAGLDDSLYGLAYATCYSDEDWRRMAVALEALKREWPTDRARHIYRKLGDREKYLELRCKKLVYGGDYHDLASFYWDEGNHEKALAVAEEGEKKGQGRMDELRKFLSDRALESNNRKRYLALQFEQATDHLTLAGYKAFKKICTAEEWSEYEPQLIKRLDSAWTSERLKVLMHREEYEKALAVLLKERHPIRTWDSGDELWTAKQLETRFPDQILTYYVSGLRNLNSNATRKEYAQRAGVMRKVRRVMVNILKDENRWKAFAGKVKRDNLRRPAFQEEFAKAIPGWRELV